MPRTSLPRNLTPGPIFMGIAAFLVVGAGVIGAANMTQFSTDNRGQAARSRCVEQGGVPVADNRGRIVTGKCKCSDGTVVNSNVRCTPQASPQTGDGSGPGAPASETDSYGGSTGARNNQRLGPLTSPVPAQPRTQPIDKPIVPIFYE